MTLVAEIGDINRFPAARKRSSSMHEGDVIGLRQRLG